MEEKLSEMLIRLSNSEESMGEMKAAIDQILQNLSRPEPS